MSVWYFKLILKPVCKPALHRLTEHCEVTNDIKTDQPFFAASGH